MEMGNVEKYFFIIINILLLIGVITWISSKLLLNNKNCRRLDKYYNKFPTIGSINHNNDNYKDKLLRDFYVKSAYNCCAAGNYKNDYVNLCALEACIKQGVRFLDFEIYSIENKPVVSISSKENYNIKQSFNYLSLGSVLDKINHTAFSSGRCPNSSDPLILNFRIMSANKEIYDLMASNIENSLGHRLLSNEYTHLNNFGGIEINKLKNKVIIIVDYKNNIYKESDTSLKEYTNLNSNKSKVLVTKRFFDIKNTHEPDIFLFNNKEHMSICIPDLNSEPINYNPTIPMKYGCQFITMSFQKMDNNLRAYIKFFDEYNCAFVLKPKELRHTPATITEIDAPPESLTLGDKVGEVNWFGESRQFNI